MQLRTYQADPERENWCWEKKTDVRFAFKNNTITHAYASSITRFDINILENA